MKIALQGTTLLIKGADNVQFAVIKSWNKMRWDRKTQLLTGTADMELLDKLASIVQLPPAIAQRRSQLHRVQEAIDSERVNPHPKPLTDYPVKMSLYASTGNGDCRESGKPDTPSSLRGRATPRPSGILASPPLASPEPPCSRTTRP